MQKTKADVGGPAEINQKLLENEIILAEKGQSYPFGNFSCFDVLHSHSEKGTQKLNNKWLFKCLACGKRKLEVDDEYDGRNGWNRCERYIGARNGVIDGTYALFCWQFYCYKGHELEVHHWLAGATSAIERNRARIFRYTLRKHTPNEPRIIKCALGTRKIPYFQVRPPFCANQPS